MSAFYRSISAIDPNLNENKEVLTVCGVGFACLCLLWKLCGGSITDIFQTILSIIVVGLLIYVVIVLGLFALKTFHEWMEVCSHQVDLTLRDKREGITTTTDYRPKPRPGGSRMSFDPPDEGNTAESFLLGGLTGGLNGLLNNRGSRSMPRPPGLRVFHNSPAQELGNTAGRVFADAVMGGFDGFNSKRNAGGPTKYLRKGF